MIAELLGKDRNLTATNQIVTIYVSVPGQACMNVYHKGLPFCHKRIFDDDSRRDTCLPSGCPVSCILLSAMSQRENRIVCE